MSLLEILFLLANLLPLLLAFTFGWRERPYWFDYLPVAGLLLAGSHLVFEGFRWQMVPGYGLTVLLFLIILPRLRSSSHSHQPRKAFMILGGLAGLLLWGVAIALSSLFPIFRFPTLSGPYGIGTVTYHWVDLTRLQTFTDDPNTNARLDARENGEAILNIGDLRGKAARWKAEELLVAVGLEERIDFLPADLSGGEKQHGLTPL